jgi:acyl-CoA synthetase (NDP forming)
MLDGLFRPGSVAVIGASNNPYSIGHIVIKNLAHYGFRGPIYPINPKERSIRSFKCFKSVLDVPDEIDLVNISVKYSLVPGVIKECGEKGVKFAIVHTAGFKEVGPEGVAREREMVELAHGYGMRIFGPNSQGIQNADPEVSVYANFTFVPMKPGNISIIAQGGGMGEMLKLHLHNVGLGHRMYCSYGNESDLTMPEILEYYGQDEGTKAIMMQIESFKDPLRFYEVARKITPSKPILAIKAGRTREGSVAVSSHTGLLVDQAAMATAMFHKAGVLEFTDTHRMIKAAISFSTQTPPPGNRIGMITNTGGPGIQMVDEAIEAGLTLATWSAAGRERLQQSLYAEASLGNPVDVVATANHDHYFAAMDTLLKEDGTDMVLVFFVTAPFTDINAIAARIKEATEGSDKPVVVVVETFSGNYALIDKLRAAGLPVFEFPEDGARALAAMNRYRELRGRPREEPPLISADRDSAAGLLRKYEGLDTYLPQAEAFALLEAYGVATPRLAVVESEGGLGAAADQVGFPCVLKIDAVEVVHKSDAGGVVLNLGDLNDLRTAFAELQRRFAGREARYLVMAQKAAGREIIIGAKNAPGLGSLVLFGLGGIMVEVMQDVMIALAPLSGAEAREMMRGIKGFQVLAGMRGQAAADLDAIADLLIRISRLAADFPQITEMDINPILVYPGGAVPVAVDVRVKVR